MQHITRATSRSPHGLLRRTGPRTRTALGLVVVMAVIACLVALAPADGRASDNTDRAANTAAHDRVQAQPANTTSAAHDRVEAQPADTTSAAPAPDQAQPDDTTDNATDNATDDTPDDAPGAAPPSRLIGEASGPMALLVADSEFVFGPTLYGFAVDEFVAGKGGYLARYNEIVDGEVLSGTDIVSRVAEEFSVGPRLLLALIEMNSGWVRNAEPSERNFPVAEPLPGLHASLSSAADKLNGHYYTWRLTGQRSVALAGGVTVRLDAPNAGTYGIVAYLSQGVSVETFASMVDTSRFYIAWTSLFGDASAYAAAPTLPDTIPLLDLRLPFAPAEVWFYVQGPRSPWGAAGPRAAIDFAPPPPELLGCAPAPSLVRTAAAGRVMRSRSSGVLVDTDGDDFIGSGWVHVYSHLTTINRVPAGQKVSTGDQLGHASCDAGATGLARVAFSRRYNGEWIPADASNAPLVLSGWAVLAGLEPGEGWLIHKFSEPREAAFVKNPQKNGVTALPDGTP